MKDLLSGESMLFTELQNSALLKNYLHFEVWKFGRVSYKRGWLHWIFWYINFFQLLLHRQQIWSIFFSKFFFNFWFFAKFARKNSENDNFEVFPAFFSFKIGIASKTDNIFEKSTPDLPIWVDDLFYISAKLDSKCKSSLTWNILKFNLTVLFYKKLYQISEL